MAFARVVPDTLAAPPCIGVARTVPHFFPRPLDKVSLRAYASPGRTDYDGLAPVADHRSRTACREKGFAINSLLVGRGWVIDWDSRT
mgnify:CR=1 FL=1